MMKIEFKENFGVSKKIINDDGSYSRVKFKWKVINKMLNLICNNIINYGVDENGYTDIPKIKFKESRTEDLLEAMRLDNLIMRNFYSKEKHKSFGYRLSESIKEKLEIESIILEANDLLDDDIEASIKFDVDKGILDRLYQDYNSVTFSDEIIKKEYNDNGEYILIDKWLNNIKRLERWKNDYKFFKFKSNRLYTNFTYLSSSARLSQIRLNGEELIEYDIHSSFPLMLALYLSKINPNLLDDYEFKKFCKEIVKGTFYGKLQYGLNSIRNINKEGEYDEETGEIDKSIRFISKSEAKIIFQTFLNSKLDKKNAYLNHLSIDVKGFMKLNYTSIYDAVLNIKSENKIYDLLVSQETSIIFSLLKKLYKIEGIKILTCHDAIYVPKSFKSSMDIIWDDFMNQIKKQLKIKDETYVNYNQFLNYGD